jgi:hypothetical protein
VFKRYDGDFYKVDPMLFSPARVAVTNTRSGRTFEAGRLNAAVLGSRFSPEPMSPLAGADDAPWSKPLSLPRLSR